MRRDLRLADNGALAAAIERAEAVVPVYVTPAAEGRWRPGAASRAWTALTLAALDIELRALGSRAVARSGDTAPELARLAVECGASLVTCQRDWTPPGMAEEAEVAHALATRGVELAVFEGSLLATPYALRTKEGRPYSVFTPFHRAWVGAWRPEPPLPPPARIPGPSAWPDTGPLPSPPAGAPDLAARWDAGPRGATERLDAFVAGALEAYADDRDRPDTDGTSRLSPYLATGALSPRQIVHGVAEHDPREELAGPFIRQLAWREFAYHVLHHHPDLPDRPLRRAFAALPWREDPAALEAWRDGRTGYPLVDAGMRQLAATGWMHNRARLVVGSFLTKDLLIPWQEGEAWFWERLADADLAQNAFNWQWVAGCGADAAPYFRVFNPVLQGAKHDPDGAYVSRWVPELAELPAKWAHRPWEAPGEVLTAAGVALGRDYPHPIVDHYHARDRALSAFETVKQSGTEGPGRNDLPTPRPDRRS